MYYYLCLVCYENKEFSINQSNKNLANVILHWLVSMKHSDRAQKNSHPSVFPHRNTPPIHTHTHTHTHTNKTRFDLDFFDFEMNCWLRRFVAILYYLDEYFQQKQVHTIQLGANTLLLNIILFSFFIYGKCHNC